MYVSPEDWKNEVEVVFNNWDLYHRLPNNLLESPLVDLLEPPYQYYTETPRPSIFVLDYIYPVPGFDSVSYDRLMAEVEECISENKSLISFASSEFAPLHDRDSDDEEDMERNETNEIEIEEEEEEVLEIELEEAEDAAPPGDETDIDMTSIHDSGSDSEEDGDGVPFVCTYASDRVLPWYRAGNNSPVLDNSPVLALAAAEDVPLTINHARPCPVVENGLTLTPVEGVVLTTRHLPYPVMETSRALEEVPVPVVDLADEKPLILPAYILPFLEGGLVPVGIPAPIPASVLQPPKTGSMVPVNPMTIGYMMSLFSCMVSSHAVASPLKTFTLEVLTVVRSLTNLDEIRNEGDLREAFISALGTD